METTKAQKEGHIHIENFLKLHEQQKVTLRTNDFTKTNIEMKTETNTIFLFLPDNIVISIEFE